MDLTGTKIGQYDIVERIGQGGMATVYKAYQASLDRYVAVKVLIPDLSKSEDFLIRFEREARTIAKLRHRNILAVFDYGREQGLLYLAMEHISGGTLKDRLGWPQKLDDAVNTTIQVGSALAYAHKQGVIHRDIKPANVLVAADDWLLLSDFGLVKMAEDSLQLTMSGTSLGTPQYMSPEQAQAMELDHRSDIYSLGVVLYESITGQPPFGTDNPVAIIMKHINEPIIPPRTLRSDLPASMERVMLKALAKSPEDRYQRMEDFIDDLREAHAALGEPSPSANGSPTPKREPTKEFITKPIPVQSPTTKPRKKNSPKLQLIIRLLLLVIIGLTLFLFKEQMMMAVALVNSSFLNSDTPIEAASTSETPTPTTTGETAATEFTPSTVPPLAATPVEEATPTAVAIKTEIWPADGAEMVFVPAGEFVMGSETLGDDERPVRLVYLDDFWLDRYEVTNEQFARFIEASGYETEAEKQGWGWVHTGSEWEEVAGANWRHPRGPKSDINNKSNHPVVLVGWRDANAYCEWADKRLPTEAEWEKAARGPTAEIGLEQNYTWGDTFDTTRTNTKESSYDDTTPVGAFSPEGDSPYGAADMAGNAWEWTADWYDDGYYAQALDANPTGPANGIDKVLRGGSWLFDQLYARTAFRYNLKPDYTYDFTGFRCSRSD